MTLMFARWAAATNLCTNGGFETNTTGWAASGSPASTIARSTAWSKLGDASLAITNTDNDNYCALYAITFPSAGTYVLSFWMKTPAGMASEVGPSFTGFSGATLGPTNYIGAGLEQRVQRWLTVVAGGLAGSVGVYKVGAAETGPIYIDGVQIEAGSVATPYIETDGATSTRSAGHVILDSANPIKHTKAQYS